MLEALPYRVDSVEAQQRQRRWTAAAGFLAVIGTGLLIGVAGVRPLGDPYGLSLGAFACVALAIVIRPVFGIYLTTFFSIIGDKYTLEGYPFNLNFSSFQSFLYTADSFTFTPMELCLVLTALGWFAQMAGAREWRLFGRPLVWPVLLFGVLVFVGLLWGVRAQSGNLTVAIWELRPLLYVVAMYVLTSNLLTRTSQYVRLAWLAAGAITIQSVFSIRYYFQLPVAEREELGSLTEHSNSLFYVWVLVLLMALFLFRGTSRMARALVLLAAIPATWVLVLSQRRAAIVALGAGFVVVAIVLFCRRRKAFFVVVPIVLLATAAYSAAFWNTEDGIGFGAQAVKSVIAPGDLSEADQSSNLYRDVEAYDLVYTMRAQPLMGVGFGKPFYQPAPLPFIQGFGFSEYIPHNSIVWIWLKMGYLGFVVFLFIIAATIRAGTHAFMRLVTGTTLATTVAALAFVVMFVIFAYVDIVWAPQTALFLGVCIAVCANIQRLAAQSDELVDAEDFEADFEAIEELAQLSYSEAR